MAWTPKDLPNVVLWHDASQLTGFSNGDPVNSWDDESGNWVAALFNNGSSSTQPTYTTNAINGLPALNFNGSNGQYLEYSFGMSSDTTVFTVAITNSDPASSTALSGPVLAGWGPENSGSYSQYPDEFGTLYDHFNSSSLRITRDLPEHSDFYLSDWHIYSVQSGTGTWGNWINGNEIFLTSSNTPAYSSNARIGKADFSGSPSFDGKVAEVIVYDGIPSESDRQKIEGYLAWKYGLQAELPVDHDFKDFDYGAGGAWKQISASGINSSGNFHDVNLSSPINHQSPLAKGLLNAFITVPQISNTSKIIDLVGNNHARLNNAIWGMTAKGSVLHYQGSQFSYIQNKAGDLDTDTWDFERSDKFSVMLCCLRGDTTANTWAVGKQATSGAFPGWGLTSGSGVYSGDDGRRFAFQLRSNFHTASRLEMISPTNKFSDGGWHSFVATYNGSSNVSGVALFEDGKIVSGTPAINALGTWTTKNAGYAGIGGRNNASAFSNMKIHSILVWNRVLTSDEVQYAHQQWTQDYPDLLNRQNYFWVPYSASSGGEVTGDVTIDCESTITASGFVSKNASVVLDGSSDIESSGFITKESAVIFDNNSEVDSGGFVIKSSTAIIDSSSTLEVDSTINKASSVDIDGESVMVVSGVVVRNSSATLNADAIIDADSYVAQASTTIIDGTVDVIVSPQAVRNASSTINGSSEIQTNELKIVSGETILSNSATLIAESQSNVSSGSDIEVFAELDAQAGLIRSNSSTLDTDSNLLVSGLVAKIGLTDIESFANIEATPITEKNAEVELEANCELVADGLLLSPSGVDVFAEAELIGSGYVISGGSATPSATADLIASSTINHGASAIISAEAELVTDGLLLSPSGIDVLAEAELIGSGYVISSGSATPSATADLVADRSMIYGASIVIESNADLVADSAINRGNTATISAEAELVADGLLLSPSGVDILAEAELIGSGYVISGGSATPSATADLVADSLMIYGASIVIESNADLIADGDISNGSTIIVKGECVFNANAELIFSPYYTFDLETYFTIPAVEEFDLTSEFNVGHTELRWYQVETACTTAACETDSVMYCKGGQRTLMVLAARGLADLCTQLRRHKFFGSLNQPIRKVTRSSRPVYPDRPRLPEVEELDPDTPVGYVLSCEPTEIPPWTRSTPAVKDFGRAITGGSALITDNKIYVERSPEAQIGDLIVLVLSKYGVTHFSPGSGWNILGPETTITPWQNIEYNSVKFTGAAYYKICGLNEPLIYEIPISIEEPGDVAYDEPYVKYNTLVIRGVDQFMPFADTQFSYNNSSGDFQSGYVSTHSNSMVQMVSIMIEFADVGNALWAASSSKGSNGSGGDGTYLVGIDDLDHEDQISYLSHKLSTASITKEDGYSWFYRYSPDGGPGSISIERWGIGGYINITFLTNPQCEYVLEEIVEEEEPEELDVCNTWEVIDICHIDECVNFCVDAEPVILGNMYCEVVEVTANTFDGSVEFYGTSQYNVVNTPFSGVIFGGEAEYIFRTSLAQVQSSGFVQFGGALEQDTSILEANAEAFASVQFISNYYSSVSEDHYTPRNIMTTTTNGCTLPSSVYIRHNLRKQSQLTSFLSRSGNIIPHDVILHSTGSGKWRANYNFEFEDEVWRVVFEYYIFDSVGFGNIDDFVWRLGIFVSREDDHIDLKSRFLVEFNSTHCPDQSLISLSCDTDKKYGEVNGFDANVVLTDDVGIFSGMEWERDPMLNILISSSSNFGSTGIRQ